VKEKIDLDRNVLVKGFKPYCLAHAEPIEGTMNKQYDAYYCEPCNRWLEKGCDGSKKVWDESIGNWDGSMKEEGCPYDCANRPEKPII